MTRKTREAAARLERLEHMVDGISRSIEKIEVATIVRDPSSGLAAEAYEGLRKQVIAAAGDRMRHLHQLARFAEAIDSGHVAALPDLVREWTAQAGLLKIHDPADVRCYEVLGGEGDQLRVLRFAYVDEITGRVVVMGQAERVQSTVDSGAHRRMDVGDQEEVRS
ncbi:hypothetical protein [Lentzea sp. NBRC 102530]|uniref:hypothetical protein n=1 Tax=Lentzea sp. NBRC 102530 TaxID=3032201 RepID=UPI0024A0100A|nr:hypothetical protein [Lentzea sp. NBRC 102530]GLY47521.1 hypothetical protein Lesp01_11770 [Lentzea sp. NBRC 102530]